MDRAATPRVSVLMPVYNGERFLREAIDSILSQDYDDFELVIVDDGSQDGTAAIIASYRDPRIVSLCSTPNQGVIAARTKALSATRGEYIALMDSDDISLTGRLARQVAYLDQHLECGVVAARVHMIDTQGASKGIWQDEYAITTQEQIRTFLPKANCIAHSTVMVRGDLLRKHGYCCPSGVTEDYDLWLRLAASGVIFAKLPEVLVHYRLTPGSLTSLGQVRPAEYQQIRNKWHFLSMAIKQGRIDRFSRQVAIALTRDIVNLGLKKIFRLCVGTWPHANRDLLAVQLNRSAMGRLLIRFTALMGAVLPLQNRSGMFFFFPFFHAGGAERVHAAIVNCFTNEQPWVIFTKRSSSSAFRPMFGQGARLLNLWPVCKYFYPFSVGLAAGFINRHHQPVVFGANSLFYALLVPYLKPHVRCSDLIHAFGAGVEDFTLPAAQRLDQRVVINQQTQHDLTAQYAQAGLAPPLSDRINLIGNRVTVPKVMPVKQWDGPLRLLFVGRGSAEKRVHLIGQAVRRCVAEGLQLEATLVGDVAGWLESGDAACCVLTGPVYNDTVLQGLYAQAHLVLITSSREGFPLTLMEGMAQGCVPLCSSIGGIPEHIRHAENGWLLPAEDEAAVVDALCAALHCFMEDRVLLARLAASAYHYARHQFGGARFCEQYRQVIYGR